MILNAWMSDPKKVAFGLTRHFLGERQQVSSCGDWITPTVLAAKNNLRVFSTIASVYGPKPRVYYPQPEG